MTFEQAMIDVVLGGATIRRRKWPHFAYLRYRGPINKPKLMSDLRPTTLCTADYYAGDWEVVQ